LRWDGEPLRPAGGPPVQRESRRVLFTIEKQLQLYVVVKVRGPASSWAF
jgi:hypothetical protein